MSPLSALRAALRHPAILSCFVLFFAATAEGRPAHPTMTESAAPPVDVIPSFLVTGLSSAEALDTTWYGGTVWAPDSNRWEAIRGGTWTFDSGVGSAIQGVDPQSKKPAGYHRLMEGWSGLSYTRRVLDVNFRRSTTCVITGSFSMWLGKTAAEIEEAGACWATGPGYGNNWEAGLEQTFAYAGSGDVTLQFRYAVDAEPYFDGLAVLVRPSGSSTDILLASYDDAVSGLATFTLRQVDGALPPASGSVTIRFIGFSDGSYSDEDGSYPTTCGLAAVDDIALSGAITHATNFESGVDGWAPTTPSVIVDDFSDLRDSADLLTPSLPSLFLCSCGLRDSVLVFMDPNGTRPGDYPTGLAISPWIDLKAGGDVGRPGALIRMNIDTGPMGISPAVVTGAQYYPYVCPSTGRISVSPIQWTSTIFFFGSPGCGSRLDFVGYYAPPGAEQVRIVVGPIQNNGLVNPPPYIDNVQFGVYGPSTAPLIQVDTRLLLQDNFASDGTLNPSSTARLDPGYPTSFGLTPYFGDTLVAGVYGQNVEVRLVFHARPGPFTSPSALATAAARWTPEPAIGSGWYSARMDTSRFGSNWMSCFHENDPGFTATDDTPDPNDPGHLANDILPDHVFTPGSRIDYFLQARYRPPDPRNPGGDNWFIVPDTTDGNFFEAEILPSSMDADSTWNCVLVASDYLQTAQYRRDLENAAVSAVLGPGTVNTEKTRFDRMDFLYRFARGVGSTAGITAAQLAGYQLVAWQNGQQFNNGSTNIDVPLLDSWLRTDDGVRRGFYGNGGVLISALQNGGATTRSFLNSTLGVRQVCTGVRAGNCPSGTLLDSTFCLPLASTPSPDFANTGNLSVAGNGCPNLIGHQVLSTEPSVPEAKGNLQYIKNGSPISWASISLDQPSGHDYRSVVDGFPLYLVRRSPANPHSPAQCTNLTGMYERAFDVLGWLGSPNCLSVTVSDVPDPVPGVAPRPFLSDPRPNPSTGAIRISFGVPQSGTATRIDLFDVTGRLVRTLVDGAMDAGTHELTWDGRSAGGAEVGAGLYFYRMASGDFVETRKLLVVR